MIVRDESAVIERCVASVRDVVDTWVVCDTGSTDDTPTRLAAAFNGMPGVLHRRPWFDFGHNRTELMHLARGAADYLLLLDADMTLVHKRPLPTLAADAYLLRHTGDLDYAVPRLVRGDRAWRFEGATHEYLTSDTPFSLEPLAAWEVEHHADGGSRGDKLERDRALLERQIAATPDDPRSLFYLAQTLRDLGETDRAVECYRRRVDAGGWDEEVFYAQYQVGALLAAQDWDAAVPELLRAWELRPARAEPLHELDRGYRVRGGHRLAGLFAERGLAVDAPDDLLFVHRDVYDWGLRFERSIAAYWNGDFETALADNDLLLAQGVPAGIEPWVHHNREWCRRALGLVGGPEPYPVLEVRHVPLLGDLAPSTRVDALVIPTDPGFTPMNPSIASDGDGFRLVVRTVNYDLLDGIYRYRDDDEVVRTRNHLAHMDSDLTIRSVAPLAMVPDGPPTWSSSVVGCEDCRLVAVDGRWYASATVRDRNPTLVCQMALLALDGADAERMVVLPSPDSSVHEKNWMPFVLDGGLAFLYSCAPTVVLRCDPASGALETVSTRQGPDVARGFRGGSQGVPIDGGWLFVVHETAALDGTRRSYVHRLVRLRADLVLDAVSDPFVFVGPGVEFCAGTAVHGDQAVLSFGVGDRGAYLAQAPLTELLALLRPLPFVAAAHEEEPVTAPPETR